MDAASLMEEYRLAQEEHERALGRVKEMRERVEVARAEVAQAQAVERGHEREMEVAAAKMAEGLLTLHIQDDEPGSAPTQLPRVKCHLVEYHANIGCYHCYLRLDGEVSPSTVDTSTISIGVQLTKVSFSSATGVWWAVELERKVDAENCSITAKGDHIYIRMPVGESDKETVDGFSSFSQTTQEELRVDSYAKLSCRACGLVLKDDAEPIDKVLPLPSENWMEMFDFWGAGIGSFEHIPREGILAHTNRIFVGESNIILHEGNLRNKSLIVNCEEKPSAATTAVDEDVESKHQDWMKVSCSGCNVILGHRLVENAATLQLEKHLLFALKRGSGVNVFECYTIDSTISAQMLHVAESDGVFRFLLRSEASEGDEDAQAFRGLQVQLLNWDTKILSSSMRDFRRVLKVVYTPVPESAVSVAPGSQADLPPMLQTQVVTVTAPIGIEVTRRLAQSTSVLPLSQRSFNKMTVGYLYA